MGVLFGRRAVLQMRNVEVDGLRVSFKIEKNHAPEPNSAEISVWNLSRDTRAQLLGVSQTDYATGARTTYTQSNVKRSMPIALHVGYGSDIEQIFVGDILRDGISTTRDGGDWVTTFKAGDGAEAYRTARIQESFAKGAKVGDVIKKLAQNLGVNAEKALAEVRQGNLVGGLTEFFEGTVLSGKVSDELTRLCDSVGYEWSVQDDQLQVIEKGGWSNDQVVVLGPETGLVGSPEPGQNKKDKPALTKFRSLLQPAIRPLRRVQIESEEVNGIFVVFQVTHSGDTSGSDWYSDCEARPIS
jgi:hypothetical protein